jgi:hypothetical protein
VSYDGNHPKGRHLQRRTVTVAGENRHIIEANINPKKRRRVYTLAELKAAKRVFYVSTNNSVKNVYEPNSSWALATDPVNLSVAFSLNLFSGFADSYAYTVKDGITSIELLALNNGEINYLNKKGVKLVGLKDAVIERLRQDNVAEDFMKKYYHETALTDVRLIWRLANTLCRCMKPEEIQASPIDIMRLITEYSVINAQDAKTLRADAAMKVELAERIGMHVEVAEAKKESQAQMGKMEKGLLEKYPLLGLIDYDQTFHGGKSAARYIQEYIVTQDSKISVQGDVEVV